MIPILSTIVSIRPIKGFGTRNYTLDFYLTIEHNRVVYLRKPVSSDRTDTHVEDRRPLITLH